MTEARPAAGGREGRVYPETKGREYKEVSRLAESIPKKTGEETLIVFADCFDPRLTAPALGEKPSLLPLPQRGPGSAGCDGGDQLEVSE